MQEPTGSARRLWTTALWGGLAAGVGDTLLALVLYRVSVVRIYQSIAAGLLGRDSFQGGLATAALGMFLHFFIATTAALVYVVASTRLKPLLKQPVSCGLAFGIAVYFFMNFVVLPFSKARAGGFAWPPLIGHALLVGLPIALVARYRLPRFISPSR